MAVNSNKQLVQRTKYCLLYFLYRKYITKPETIIAQVNRVNAVDLVTP